MIKLMHSLIAIVSSACAYLFLGPVIGAICFITPGIINHPSSFSALLLAPTGYIFGAFSAFLAGAINGAIVSIYSCLAKREKMAAYIKAMQGGISGLLAGLIYTAIPDIKENIETQTYITLCLLSGTICGTFFNNKILRLANPKIFI